MDRHPIFFVTELVYFRGVCWVFSALNLFSLAFVSLWNKLVNTSVKILYLLCFCALIFRCIDVCEICVCWLILLLLAQLCDLVTTLEVGGVD